MHHSLGRLQIFLLPAVLTGLGLATIGGCTADFSSFPSGVYTGAPSCLLDVTDPTGATGQETLTENLTVAIDPLNAFTINDVPVVIGAQHVRSLPNADLAFEIVATQHSAGYLQITYEPRPSLPGIEIGGSLVETYRWNTDHIEVSGIADLTVSDATGVTLLTVTCDGTLVSSALSP